VLLGNPANDASTAAEAMGDRERGQAARPYRVGGKSLLGSLDPPISRRLFHRAHAHLSDAPRTALQMTVFDPQLAGWDAAYEVVMAAIEAHPKASDRAIGRECECSHHTVAKARRLLAERRAAEQRPGVSRWKPLRRHGPPFSDLEKAQQERDELFVQVQELQEQVRGLRERLA
jgi:hypothetical protein